MTVRLGEKKAFIWLYKKKFAVYVYLGTTSLALFLYSIPSFLKYSVWKNYRYGLSKFMYFHKLDTGLRDAGKSEFRVKKELENAV